MIMAIILIVVLTTIMALTLTFTSQTTKQTTDLYLREQAVLLAQSAAEYTMLAISGHDRGVNGNTNCLGAVNIQYPTSINPIFDINVSIGYIGLNCQNGFNYIQNISTPESNGTVLLDITVSSDSNTSTEPIRYFRRTIQKL
ncbi:MAG: type II secretion system protein [Thiovulaceae bacterium]|nr:type II secretion system protein [Sulfurimonadaceae bacterium]